MEIFSDVNKAWDAICDYMILKPDAVNLSEETKQTVSDMLKGSSVSFAVAHFAEYAFARKDELPESFLILAAACAHICTINPGGVDSVIGERGLGLRDALRRDGGEAGKWPKPSEDPEPRQDFLPVSPSGPPITGTAVD